MCIFSSKHYEFDLACLYMAFLLQQINIQLHLKQFTLSCLSYQLPLSLKTPRDSNGMLRYLSFVPKKTDIKPIFQSRCSQPVTLISTESSLACVDNSAKKCFKQKQRGIWQHPSDSGLKCCFHIRINPWQAHLNR